MTEAELRALAETLRDMQADVSGENKGWSVAYSAFKSACTYERILTVLDASAAMVAALSRLESLMSFNEPWHPCACYGEPDALNDAMQQARAALALAENAP